MFEGLYQPGTFYTLAIARNLHWLEPFLCASRPCVSQKDEVCGYGELVAGRRQFNLHCPPPHKFRGRLPFIFHFLDVL